ncbi:MAG: polysaccharide biosynthesis transport protein [Acidobacteriota bacterium]|jgi:capsular exopolysaccharide synthesis family protein|nr:polysaccharide biosynthesis transport protein [Acidobacteriota bacterium]
MPQDQRLMPPYNDKLDYPLSDISQRISAAEALPRQQDDLREYLDAILKRKWAIAGLALITTFLVALYMYRLPSVYEAQTTIRIEPKNESYLRSKDIVINTASDPVYRQTQLKLLENPQLMRQLALTLDLPHNPEFLAPSSTSSLLSARRQTLPTNQASSSEVERTVAPVAGTNVDSLTAEQRTALAPYVSALLANLSFESVTGTNLVNIRFRHTSPAIAMKVTDTLAQLFIENDTNQATLGMQNAATQLAKQIADLQSSIKKLEDERLDYMKSHELPLGEGKGQNLTAERLGTLSGELLAAENERQSLQTAYEAARQSTNPWDIPQIQENKNIQELRQQIRGLEQRRASLLIKYTPAWPEVMQLEEEIKRLKQDLEKSPHEIITAMRLRYETALAREEQLRRTYFKEHGAANQQSQAGVELSDINNKLETDKQLYSTLFQRQEELQINSSGMSDNVRIENPSELPVTPVGPARVKNIILSFLLSLGAGIGLAILLYKFDGAVESAEEAALYTQLPMLAIVPATRKQFLPLRRKDSANPGGDGASLALIEDGRSPLSEAYRHLRTSLLKSSNMRAPKSILVTSGVALEGKTTTAMNTAAIFALTGKDVLLVDCDLRRPRLHTRFGFPESPGLTECLAGKAEAHAALRAYGKLPNLKILTAGQVPLNPSELLGSDEMRSLLETMGQQFDHIIIDSPPAISFTDAAILSTLVDGVLVVVREGKSSRKMVRRVKQQLTDIGANIYGIVLNDAKAGRPDYYDDYYASYYRTYETVETATVEQTVQTTAWVSIESSEIEQAFKKFRRDAN